ncbi:glutamyl-tRNA amidotransferase-like protein subunit A [Penicillium lagena]|uniref:glutamyl-tRNA amidotransferase-like protein subunit A n=1 Tax=Penicillium lagena TaxID=94218 RepID=UPI00253FF96A|nr:glutamyl-tRNA amidotransferase-like protein subunit A [Penicillium lagena]KAJ5604670.1 glutamyl-tRNA amidotransferase-like protein subunit A [Penicillium lagena]
MNDQIPSWQQIGVARRAQISRKIPDAWKLPEYLLTKKNFLELPKICGILSKSELEITEKRAVDIVSLVQTGLLTSVEVTIAFCKRAAIAHQTTNCLAEILFEEAIAQAEALDEYQRVHRKTRGPLHGLPVSVKEHIRLKGSRATSGLISWANAEDTEDAHIVKIFREQGAVFHVKTTNPQSLMSLETNSNIFGRTLNPHNADLTSGGSSGGEAALLAMRGSILGIGTDIGGSIRVPCAACGIYGLKPSVGRLPHSGLSGLHEGMQNIVGVVGPMALCPEDLELFCTAALRPQPWLYEPSVIEIPWRITKSIPVHLKIGVMWNDSVVQPHPPVSRALKRTVSALKEAGHSVVDWEPHLHEQIYNVANEAYFLDGGEEYFQTLEKGKEPPVAMLKWLLDTKALRRYSIEDSFKVNATIEMLKTLYTKQWNATKVDAIICPVRPTVAAVHDESRYWGYTSVFNVLDYSSVSIPVGTVNETDTWENFPPASPKAMSSLDAWYRELYDNAQGYKRYQDAPLSIQIVGRRLEEERTLRIATLISQLLAAYKPV